MIDEQLFARINKKLESILPEGMTDIRDEVATNIKMVIKENLNKLDLVTREEFEIQKAVLEKANKRLKALEAQVQELEGSK